MTQAEAEFLSGLFNKYDPNYTTGITHFPAEDSDGMDGNTYNEYCLVFKPKADCNKPFIAKHAELLVRDSRQRLSAKFLKEWVNWRLGNGSSHLD